MPYNPKEALHGGIDSPEAQERTAGQPLRQLDLLAYSWLLEHSFRQAPCFSLTKPLILQKVFSSQSGICCA